MLPLQKDLLVITLKEIVNELIITNRGRYVPSMFSKKEPIHVRFKSKLHESTYKQLDPFQLDDKKLDEIRVEWEINSIITALSRTLYEILEKSTFDTLLDIINGQNENFEEEKKLLEEYKLNIELIHDLKTKLKNHVYNAEVKIHCRDEILSTLKNEFNNIKRINSLELNLVVKWEKTRFEQARILNSNRANEVLETIRVYKIKTEGENRIIHDIENINELKFNHFEERTLYWKGKHVSEMIIWDEKIRKNKEEIELIQAEYEKQRKIYDERQEFIDAYLAQRAEEQRQHDFQMRRIHSAIKIQAWWRGTMVRRCLGPYKRKKKGKKGKKGK